MRKLATKKKSVKKPIKLSHSKTIVITTVMLLITLSLFVLEVQRVQEPRTRAEGQNCQPTAAEIEMNAEEQKLLQLINEYRAANNLPALKQTSKLTDAAVWFSQDLNKTKKLEHTDSLGRDLTTRLMNCGYVASGFGENIANASTAQGAFEQWKKSPPHNEEMLDPGRKVAGIGQTGNFWVLDAGNDEGIGTEEKRAEENPGGASPSQAFFPLAPCPGCSPTQSPNQAGAGGTTGGGSAGGNVTTTPTKTLTPSSAPKSGTLPNAGTPGNGQGIKNGETNILLAILLVILQFIAELFGGK